MHHSIPAEHARHDLDLIAGHAAGDLSEIERDNAQALLDSCTSCADLRRDLVAIAAATSAIPATAAPRDFRLTDAQAASLRRGGWITTLLRPFATSRSSSRPLAMAFTSLGLAGLLVANILPALFGSAGAAGGAAPAPDAARAVPAASAASAAEAPELQAASSAPGVYPVSGGPQATGSRNGYVFGPASQPTPAIDQSGGSKSNQGRGASGSVGDTKAGPTDDPSLDRLEAAERALVPGDEANPVLVGSLVLLAIGLALFGLRFVARRVR